MKPRPVYLWRDQYGQSVHARTQKELREHCGGGRVSPIYCDSADGTETFRVGVSVGPRWFTQYAPVSVKVGP